MNQLDLKAILLQGGTSTSVGGGGDGRGVGNKDFTDTNKVLKEIFTFFFIISYRLLLIYIFMKLKKQQKLKTNFKTIK